MAGYRSKLESALLEQLPQARVVSRKEQSWCSATFAGERLQIALALYGHARWENARKFAAALPDAEFHLRDRLVADIAIASEEEQADHLLLMVEILLIENAD